MLQFTIGQINADGWTTLTTSPDSRLVYVSNSAGDDANDGSEVAPKKTISNAYRLIREGFPDWILLRRGDTFSGVTWEKSGRSASERMVVTAYGSGPRPVITGELFYWGPNAPAWYVFGNLAFTDLHLNGGGSNGRAFMFSGRMQNILVEGCRIENYRVAAMFQQHASAPRNTTLHLRRNAIVNNGDQGLMLNGADDVLLEENVFDNNGRAGGDTVFKHNVYLTEIRNLRISGNIFARGSNFGTKLSADNPGSFTDFVVRNNLYYNNGMSLDHSAGPKGDIRTTFTHQNGVIENNVFTESGRAFSNGTRQDLVGWLLNSQNVRWAGNLFVHKPPFASNDILQWGGNHKDITLTGNVVHNWNPVRPDRLGTATGPAVVTGWTFDGNRVNLDATEYLDASRSVASYNASIGGTADAVAFLQSAAQLSKTNWDARLTADAVNKYLREGFGSKQPEPQPQPIKGLEEIRRIRTELDALEAILRGNQ